MKWVITNALIIFCCSVVSAQSKLLNQLKQNEELTWRVHALYPSTMRMINLQQNETYNETIKEIRKIVLIRTRREAFTQEHFQDLLSKLQEKESYQEYLTLNETNQEVYVLGKSQSTQQLAIFWQTDGEFYLVEILGTLDIMKLMNLYRQMQSGELSDGNGFIDIIGMLGINQSKQTDN